jgi:hypothetical protein
VQNDRTVGGTYPWASWTTSSFNIPPPSCGSLCDAPTSEPCHLASGFSFTDQYGTSHNLSLGAVTQVEGYSTTSYCPPAGGSSSPGHTIPSGPPAGMGDGQVWAIWQSPSQTVADVEGFTNGTVGPFTVTDNEGLTCFFGGTGMFDPALQVYWSEPDQIEDRNGNVVKGNIDTLGRQITTGTTIGGLTYPQGTCPNCPSTTPVSYAPAYTTAVEYGVLQSGETMQCMPYNMQVTNSTQPAALVYAMPASSGGSQQYTLYNGTYTDPNNPGTPNNYGLVNELVYPDGGWVKYTWKMSNDVTDPNDPYAQAAFFEGNGEMNGTPDGNTYTGACVLQYSTPVLASRTVSFDGSTIAQTQTFTYSTTWGSSYQWTAKQTSVVTTDNISGNTFLTVYNYSPMYTIGDQVPFAAQVASGIPVESSVLYYSGSSTSTPLLRTVTKTWADLFDLAEEQTTENGLTSTTSYAIQGGGSVTSPFTLATGKSEYDFGASTATQTIAVQYQSFSSNTITADGFTATIRASCPRTVPHSQGQTASRHILAS